MSVHLLHVLTALGAGFVAGFLVAVRNCIHRGCSGPPPRHSPASPAPQPFDSTDRP
jgi:hypothetical protein